MTPEEKKAFLAKSRAQCSGGTGTGRDAKRRMVDAAMALCEFYGDSVQDKKAMLEDLDHVEPSLYDWHTSYFIERLEKLKHEHGG